jgi:hypothetical protein
MRNSIAVDTDPHAHYDRKFITTYRGGPLQSTVPLESSRSGRKPFHILSTSSLEGNEVLVNFSDGSAAIFEAEELEKLRPKPKRILSVSPLVETTSAVPEPAIATVTAMDLEHTAAMDRAVA